jgi:hypothetical protein
MYTYTHRVFEQVLEGLVSTHRRAIHPAHPQRITEVSILHSVPLWSMRGLSQSRFIENLKNFRATMIIVMLDKGVVGVAEKTRTSTRLS